MLNPFHPYGTVRHLQNKPIANFVDDDQYLLIAAAEKEGLLKVTFKVDSHALLMILLRHSKSCMKQTEDLPFHVYPQHSAISLVRSWRFSFAADNPPTLLCYHLACTCHSLCIGSKSGPSAFCKQRPHFLPLSAEVYAISDSSGATVQLVDQNALDQTADTLLMSTKDTYCSQSVSTTARAWNELREKVLIDALDNVFKPQFERELRAKLTSDAREQACIKCTRHVWKLAVEGPVLVKPLAPLPSLVLLVTPEVLMHKQQ